MTDEEALARGVALVPWCRNAVAHEGIYPVKMESDEFRIIIAALEAAERIAKPAIPEGMDVVERVARALMKARHPTWIWEDCGAYYPMFMEHARAALAAIKPEKERE